MSRIEKVLKNKKVFIGFLTAGDGGIDTSLACILAMEKAGASLVEIGIPFRDPIAEGNVIQKANQRALANKTTLQDVFALVAKVRKESQIPLVFLSYLNPVFHYGYDAFFKQCQAYQVDGIIIPDLPYEEKTEVESVSRCYGVDLISLIAPTSKARIQMIAKEAHGFLYLVSSLGVTGVRSDITSDIEAMVASIKEVSDIPVAIGFGIHSPEQVAQYTQFADGVIVGSAIVELMERYPDTAAEAVYHYVWQLVNAIHIEAS